MHQKLCFYGIFSIIVYKFSAKYANIFLNLPFPRLHKYRENINLSWVKFSKRLFIILEIYKFRVLIFWQIMNITTGELNLFGKLLILLDLKLHLVATVYFVVTSRIAPFLKNVIQQVLNFRQLVCLGKLQKSNCRKRSFQILNVSAIF